MAKTSKYPVPLIFNAFKPAGMSSYDVVRSFKRKLPKGYGKIGHFGTLDPFASGVLMLGVNGAARANDFIHEFLPKTYLAIGKLGVETETGDLTVEPSQTDDSEFVRTVIAKFTTEFIEEKLNEQFIGDYWQAPHKYSAAKFEGKALHKWAREGVEIKKEKKLRQVYKIEVVKYSFPYLSIRFQVSSGTYIRTLFSDCANYLGTIGTLISLVREQIGCCTFSNSIKKRNWPDSEDWNPAEYGMELEELLPFGTINFAEKESKLYQNGVALNTDRASKISTSNLSDDYFWVRSFEDKTLGLGKIENDQIKVQFNFPSN